MASLSLASHEARQWLGWNIVTVLYTSEHIKALSLCFAQRSLRFEHNGFDSCSLLGRQCCLTGYSSTDQERTDCSTAAGLICKASIQAHGGDLFPWLLCLSVLMLRHSRQVHRGLLEEAVVGGMNNINWWTQVSVSTTSSSTKLLDPRNVGIHAAAARKLHRSAELRLRGRIGITSNHRGMVLRE